MAWDEDLTQFLAKHRAFKLVLKRNLAKRNPVHKLRRLMTYFFFFLSTTYYTDSNTFLLPQQHPEICVLTQNSSDLKGQNIE